MVMLLFFAPSYATETSDLFYSGDVSYDLKDTYNAGDSIQTDITASNMEEFPITGAYLVIEILEGCMDPVYPSQDSDCDNIFFEKVMPGINLDPLSQVSVPFSYILPSDLKTGTYRMDVYLRTQKTPIVGMAHIFLPSRYKSFAVKGTGVEPSLKIQRTTTKILGATGPVGPPALPGSLVEGTVYIKNIKAVEEDGLSLLVAICSWDDTGCENKYVWQNTYPFSIGPTETKGIGISFDAPEKPDAYAIRLELKDKKRDIRSIYRSRLVVTGTSAKVRKLWVDKRYYNADEKVELNTLIFTSPDHYTNPVMYKSNLLVSVKDLNSDKIVFHNTEEIPELSGDVPSVSKKYSFVTTDVLERFEICAQVNSKDNEIYDKYCYEIDSSKFSSESRKYSLNEKIFDRETMEFSADLCVSDDNDRPVSSNAGISITDLKNRVSVMRENIKIDSCHPVRFTYKPDVSYRMLINDEDLKKQYRFEFQYTEPSVKPGDSDKNETAIDDEMKKDQDGDFIIVGILVIVAVILTYLYIKTRKH
ncbi:MAG: hypothetical protein ABIG84_01275 [archaeon]